MNKKKAITIHDLAKELNVSASTVSRALRGHPTIGKQTIAAVKKLAKKRGYRPNRVAANLRKQHSHSIGILVPRINRPFISSLIYGAEETAREAGYQVIIAQSHDKLELEKDDVQTLFDSRVSGLVVSLAMETENYEHFNLFLDNNIPIVFVDRIPEGLKCHKIAVNNYKAGYNATIHLIEQGCKRIAHFSGASHQNVYKERLKGYIQALQDHEIEVDESIILKGKVLSADEAVNLTKYLLDLPNPPDGIFSANDTAAVSAIQYAKSVGVSIPDQLAVIGFNNDPLSLIIDPPLSTIEYPAVELGKLAVEKALELIEGKGQSQLISDQTLELNTELIVRGSSVRN